MPASSDKRRVASWLAAGKLVHPLSSPNSVDLANTLAEAAGVPLAAHARRAAVNVLRKAMGFRPSPSPDHIVLVVLDGLGMSSLLRWLPETAFLRRHLAMPINSVFPATTSAGITSLHTGLHPSQHSLLGWTLRHADRNVNLLPYIDADTGRTLNGSVRPSDVFVTGETLMPRMRPDRRTHSFFAFGGSTYSNYITGSSSEHTSCSTLKEGLEGLREHLLRASSSTTTGPEKTYSYVYSNEPDHTSHARGYTSDAVGQLIRTADALLEKFWKSLPERMRRDRIRVVITADHGHVVVPRAKQLILPKARRSKASDNDGQDAVSVDPASVEQQLSDLLRFPPTVEPRSPCFHVLPGKEEEFAVLWPRSIFARQGGYALLTAKEAQELQLFGPDMTARAGEHLGSFVAVTPSPDRAVVNHRPSKQLGMHGGATSSEVKVPLIVLGGGGLNDDDDAVVPRAKL